MIEISFSRGIPWEEIIENIDLTLRATPSELIIENRDLILKSALL